MADPANIDDPINFFDNLNPPEGENPGPYPGIVTAVHDENVIDCDITLSDTSVVGRTNVPDPDQHLETNYLKYWVPSLDVPPIDP